MSAVKDHTDIENLPLEVDGIPVRETIREIFRNSENGTPDNISKAGCMALALKSNELGGAGKGYVAWNAWRRAFPVPYLSIVNHANFQESEFTEEMDFRLFEFGYAANFQKTIFRKNVDFDLAKFGTSTDFSFAFWAADTSFTWTQWESDIRFNYSYWSDYVNFLGAQFVSANFHISYFNKGVCFIGTGWADHVTFSSCFFNHLSCEAAEWHYLKTRFYHSTLLFDELKNYANKIGSNPTIFEGLFFTGSYFEGDVDFSNRKFSKTSLFNQSENVNDIMRNGIGIPLKDVMGNIQHVEKIGMHPVFFRVAPKFFGCELHQDISFEGAEFPKPTGSEEAARAYRTLKLAFSKQQAIREEQRFFKLEMEEETLRETGLKRQLFVAYKYFSDYGFSITRPLTLLIVFPALYIAMFNAFLIEYQIYQCYDFFNQAPISIFWNWLTWSFMSIFAVPGVNLGKEIRPLLFGSGSFISFIALMIEIIQKALALAGFFLIGLALRNLFKLK